MGSRTAIVSGAHPADDPMPVLSELELGLTLAATAFQRWIGRCALAAGAALSPIEVLILHTVRHRDRPKRLADIALVLDIDDIHLVSYAVRKLEKAGLVASWREGKEKLVGATVEGCAFCDRYAGMRQRMLAAPLAATGPDAAVLADGAALLHRLSGHYNRAARTAATL